MNFRKTLLAFVVLAFSSTAAMAYVTPGDLNRLRGLAMTLVSATVTTLTATTENITTSTIGALTLSTSFDGHALVLTSASQTTNPIARAVKITVSTSSINAGTGIILPAVTSRSIIPIGAVQVKASGTAASATAVDIKCSGGRIITKFPISMLVNGDPKSSFSSDRTKFASNDLGLTNGCPSGQSIVASTVGSALTTTTSLLITIPYVVQ